MLEQMRKQAQSAIVLLLFGFIIFVFVFSFGAGSVGFRSGGCGSSNAAAIVNGETVTLSDYRFRYQQELQQLLQKRKQGDRIRNEDKLALNDRVLNSLIDRKLVLQSARDLGLRVTDDERNAAIRKAPYFQDKQGTFDYERYKNIVRGHFKTTMSQFEELWKEDMLFNRMAEIIQATARVTDEELEFAYKQRENKVNLEYVSISPAMYRMGLTPPVAEIKAYLTSHADDIQKFYDENEGRYHKPKKIKVAHIFWRVEDDFAEDLVTDRKERAELSLDDLNNGADFAAQAKDYSQDTKTKEKGGELGTLTADAMTAQWGAPFAEAAMALKVGETSGVVRSDKGFHIIKVLDLTPAVDQALEDVRKDIAKELLVGQQAEAKATAEAEELMAGLRAGKTLEELLEAKAPAEPEEGKPAVLNPASLVKARKTGLVARMGGYIPQLGLDRDMARAAFALTKDKPIPDKIWKIRGPIGGQTLVVFRLVERQEADLSKLQEMKERLRNQLLSGRRMRQLSSWLQRRREAATIEVNDALRSELNPLAVQPQRGRGQPRSRKKK